MQGGCTIVSLRLSENYCKWFKILENNQFLLKFSARKSKFLKNFFSKFLKNHNIMVEVGLVMNESLFPTGVTMVSAGNWVDSFMRRNWGPMSRLYSQCFSITLKHGRYYELRGFLKFFLKNTLFGRMRMIFSLNQLLLQG